MTCAGSPWLLLFTALVAAFSLAHAAVPAKAASTAGAASAAAASGSAAATALTLRQQRNATQQQAKHTATCPGIKAGVCQLECQLYTCKQLAAFYFHSNNITDGWDEERGWRATQNIPCERLIAPKAAVPAYCSWFGISCCRPRDAAAGECSVVHSVWEIEMPLNNLNVSVSNPKWLRTVQALHDCGMTKLSLEANQLSGEMDDAWGDLVHLKVLNLANAWIGGPIPSVLRRLSGLTDINLSNNFLTGTLPDWLGDLENLEVLNLGSQAGTTEETGLHGTIPEGIGQLSKLRELNLEANWLTGEIPEGLCSESSSLIQLNLRANSLEGKATPVEQCSKLVQLDLSDNDLTGPLPVAVRWRDLTTYQLSDNGFSGRLPLQLCLSAHILETLDLSRNELTGALPNQVGVLGGLKTFLIASNKFTGTITEDLLYLPAIRHIDMSDNNFFGVLPAVALGFPYGLLDIDVSNNSGITGVVPAQMGYLFNLQKARFTNTSMACSGIIRPYNVTTNASCSNPDTCKTPQPFGDKATAQMHCSDEQVLPCFLRFSDESLPLDDASNMRCRYILRKLPQQAKDDCAAAQGMYGLGPDADEVMPDIVRDAQQQQWMLDPMYFQYRGCSCLTGFGEEWSRNNTVLRCVELPSSDKRTTIIVAVISAVAGLALLSALLLVAQLYMRTRPKWLREHIMESKRKQGAPRCRTRGEKVHVSIVVTDVKDYTALTREQPEAMNRAIGVHNNILRKACHTHAGYVLDQEGDSWTVAFREAEDAVAFSLQVQQALARKAWILPSSDYTALNGSTAPAVAKSHDVQQYFDAMRGDAFSAKGSTVLSESGAAPAAAAAAADAGPAGAAAAAEVGGSLSNGHVVLDPAAAAAAAGVAVGSTMSEGPFANMSLQQQVVQQQQQQQQQQQGDTSLRVRISGPLNASFTHSTGKGLGSSVSSGSEAVQGHSKTSPGGMLNRILGKTLSRQGSNNSGAMSPAAASATSDLALSARENSMSLPDAAAASSAVRRQGAMSVQPGESHREPSHAGVSEGSSATKLKATASTFMQRLTGRGSGMGTIGGSSNLGASTAGKQGPIKVLQLAVRIGIASGLLPYGCDVSECAVKVRAKELVSDVANGGQILLDEPTFLLIKDSLTVLGTVSDSGFDDSMLQQLLQAKVVGRLQEQLACYCRLVSRELSFTGGLLDREPQDYDNDAIVCHMGAFVVPDAPVDATPEDTSASHADKDTGRQSSITPTMLPKSAAAAVAAGGAELELLLATDRGRAGRHRHEQQQLHLYTIAAPGMRRPPQSTHDLARVLGWAEPVRIKPGWMQVQKSYFSAPGARQMDLTPSSQLQGETQAPLPDVTVVFAAVEMGDTFISRHSHADVHALHKAIVLCMGQQLGMLPVEDGYLCRCQESALHYMVAFEQADLAARWCLLVQEALMYVDWPEHVLAHPGFGEVVDPATGAMLFRGPRLRMGLSEGQPTCVLPDHAGRANYYGTSVNRAARYMDAAAHGGQTVTDLPLTRKLFMQWVSQDREAPAGLNSSSSNPALHTEPSTAAAAEEDDTLLLPAADQQQQQQWMPQLAVPPIAEHQPLSCERSSLSSRQLRHVQSHADSARGSSGGGDLSRGSPTLLLLAPRRSSETAARYRSLPLDHGWACRHGLYLPLAPALSRQFSLQSSSRGSAAGLGDMHASEHSSSAAAAAAAANMGLVGRSKSYTATRSRPLMDDHMHSDRVAAFVSGLPLALQQQQSIGGSGHAQYSVGDSVSALHLGKFVFKGSGEFDMVHLLQATLFGRAEVFPEHPPGGKGERVAGPRAVGGVRDLPDVRLRVSAATMAARQAFRAFSYGGARALGGGYS